jgi:hypothetical protein
MNTNSDVRNSQPAQKEEGLPRGAGQPWFKMLPDGRGVRGIIR